MRGAVVEFTTAHGETMPTFVALLNRLGIAVDVYARPQVLRSDPFSHCPGLDFSVFDLDGWETRARIWYRRFGGYDFIVANSAEPKPLLARLAAVRAPLIGVVHNAVLLDEDDEYRRFFSHPSRRPVVLGRHVSKWLGGDSEVPWIAPVHVMDHSDPTGIDWHRFCVQGRVDFRRRNYWGLLDAVDELSSSGATGFEVELVGGDRALDGTRLWRAVRQRGLDRFFVHREDPFNFAVYYRRIAAAGFILPLVDSSSPLFRPYFEDKITSSLSMALGTERIPVVHERLAALQGLADLAIGHADGALGSAMKTALDLSAEARERLVDRIAHERRRLLDASLEHLARTLSELGLTPAR